MTDLNKISLQNMVDTTRAVKEACALLNENKTPERTRSKVVRRSSVALVPLTLIETKTAGFFVAIGDKPELDPTKAQYNPEAYNKALWDMCADIYGAEEQLQQYTKGIVDGLFSVVGNLAQDAAANLLPSLIKGAQELGKWARETLPSIDWDLMPYINKELDKRPDIEEKLAHKKIRLAAEDDTEGAESTGDEADSWTISDLVKSEYWQEILEAARAAKAADEVKELREIDSKPVEKMHITTDKVNKEFWESANPNNNKQLTLNTEMTKQAGALVTTTIDFDKLPADAVKDLTVYDRRVFSAVDSLIKIKCRCVTPEAILYAMGYNGKPAQKQLDDLHRAIMKLRRIDVTIDNAAESASTSYPLFFRGTFSLLPVDVVEAINPDTGKVVKAAYLLPADEPMLMKFARAHKQVTTVPRAVYAAPLNKTLQTMQLEDFLIEQIKWMQNNPTKRNNKITFDSIHKAVKANDRKTKKRTLEKVRALLDHYKSAEGWRFISDYKETADGFLIYPDKAPELPKK